MGWGETEQIRELKAEIGRLKWELALHKKDKHSALILINEIKAALGPDWETRLSPFWVKQVATHLLECGWIKHVV